MTAIFDRPGVPTRRLGRSGIEVSAMGLGCWAIGGPWTFVDHPAGWGKVDDDESIRAIHYALDAGVTLFDTAANYGCGHSERVLGKALQGRRDQVVIATKFGHEVDEERAIVHPRQAGEVARKARADCEASLRRLGTDHIDLFQLHIGKCGLCCVDDVLAALEGLVDEGKILWYGWSTDSAEGVHQFARGPHCTAVQHMLNVANDAPEMLEACEEHDLASIARMPLGSGLLTGKITEETRFPDDDIRSLWCMCDGWAARRLRQIEAARDAMTSDGYTMAQAALAWIWARSERTIPIPGFKTVEQVRENTAAMALGPMPAEQARTLDALFGREPAYA